MPRCSRRVVRSRFVAAGVCAAVLLGSLGVARLAPRLDQQYLLDLPTAAGALNDSKRLNRESHYAGTPGDAHIAQWMRDKLASYGFDAKLETFHAEVPQPPTKIVLQLLEHPTVDFDLRESPIVGDPDGTRKNAGTLPFNAWSGSGDVTTSLVNAEHGTRADYAALRAGGISVRGRIALIAYGAEFRGLLAQRAQRHGARGVIFWSNPNDRDGSRYGPAYPNGPYRPHGSVQRGAVGPPVLQIPTLPVSANAGLRLLQSMHNRISDAPVHLQVEQSVEWEPLWNTIGTLVGSDPSHTVILGAHRDAWVYGVTDNGSGVATLLETAHALGYLYRSGWRPRYSIVIAGWDAEEVGELGSAQYVRDRVDRLFNGTIAYINADENTTGQFFAADASAPLQDLIPAATQRIDDPRDPRQTLYQRWEHERNGVQVSVPGGGSDFESFLYEAGVPVLSAEFAGPFGVYHSAFDDLRYATTQADPGFVNHRALAQLMALLAFRLANGALLYRFTPYVAEMRTTLAAFAARGATGADLAPLSAAVARFAGHAANVDERGMNPRYEIVLVHRLDRLYYGRSGYRSVRFPTLDAAIASGSHADIAYASRQYAQEVDAIDASLHPMRNR